MGGFSKLGCGWLCIWPLSWYVWHARTEEKSQCFWTFFLSFVCRVFQDSHMVFQSHYSHSLSMTAYCCSLPHACVPPSRELWCKMWPLLWLSSFFPWPLINLPNTEPSAGKSGQDLCACAAHQSHLSNGMPSPILGASASNKFPAGGLIHIASLDSTGMLFHGHLKGTMPFPPHPSPTTKDKFLCRLV